MYNVYIPIAHIEIVFARTFKPIGHQYNINIMAIYSHADLIYLDILPCALILLSHFYV
jgi:hypothetical protein